MTRQVEHQLVRTLEAAAGRAPTPEPGLLDQLERRSRRRRQRAQVALAGAAVLAVVAGSAVALGLSQPSGQSATLAPAGPSTERSTEPGPKGVGVPVEPIEKLWPDAVHNIPNRLPGGEKFRPQTMADDHTVLVSIDAGFENAGELWAYDLTDKTARKVTTVRKSKNTTIFASNFTVGEGHVVWWTSGVDEGKPVTEVWGAPLAGGAAYRVGKVNSGSGVQQMAIAISGQKVFWSLRDGGVYQAPLSGGEAKLIDGTQKFGLVQYPWVGSPVPKLESYSGEAPDALDYRTLRNLETGEERTAAARDGSWTCRVQWCVGSMNDSGFVQRRDGTGRREIGGMIGSTEYGIQPTRDRLASIRGLMADRRRVGVEEMP
ncbi:hypothetical protein, partial [Actinopolymorpha pittospori]